MVLYNFIVDETKCMNCGACMDLCPFTCVEFTRTNDVRTYGNLFEFHSVDDFAEGQPKSWMMEKPYVPLQERCTGCQICVRECPTNAIKVSADTTKPSSLKPKPTIRRSEIKAEDNYWQPLSYYTRDYLKRPVRSPWSNVAQWRPMTEERRVSQTWRSMEKSHS